MGDHNFSASRKCQYRSVILYQDEAQRETATKVLDGLKKQGKRVATTIEPLGEFYLAEQYHQKYLFKNR